MAILSASSRRWVVPAVVVLAVGAGAGGSMISASAAPELPPRTAAQLLVDLHDVHVDGLSGTVVENADLGLPALPVPGGGQGSSDLTSLISGSHTLRVWYAGPEKVRIALLGTLGESDVIRNGSDLWTWSSQQNTATHRVLPSTDHSTAGGEHQSPPASELPLTPEQAAQRALAVIDPSTAVTVDGTAQVAGRSAYELVLAPRDHRSLIGQVRIAVDSDTHIPLRVRAIARGATDPAFEIGYTHISFDRPDAAQFRFSPPPGATVTDKGAVLGSDSAVGRHPGSGTAHAPSGAVGPAHAPSGAADTMPTTIGTGWTRVMVIRGLSSLGAGGSDNSGESGGAGELGQVMAALPHVSGTWGSGRLLSSALFTALLTDDGRLIVGAVGPDLIYQAAAHR